uniref:Uncharacterized protein n=1 Tax=Anguilla anguilla TaxID=7936 RepID=A0A0E9VXX8_ANGAN
MWTESCRSYHYSVNTVEINRTHKLIEKDQLVTDIKKHIKDHK